MRKSFKPYLRHPLSKKPTVTGPNDPGPVEVTILPQWDTVLRYDGSPLMVDSKIDDPNEKSVVRGENQNYNINDENGNERDWIAIGLATDHFPIDKFRSPNPIDDIVDPNNDIADGVVYTNTGPTRSVLSFDLQDIPAGAIIEEAFLELVPVTDNSFDDVWNEFDGTINNVWPSSGIICEVLNLVEQTEEDCTWNTTTIDHRPVDGVAGYPHPPTRWHRQQGSLLPNPIGAAQNSKRWDIQEGGRPFEGGAGGVYNGSNLPDIVGDDGNEVYGHVGYGSMGGGAVENVPAEKQELDQFEISFDAHDAQTNSNANTPVFSDINVTRAVKYAHEQRKESEGNGICNLLLRATHWEGVLDLEDDQTEETFIPPVLELNSITLEDNTDTDNDLTTVDDDGEAIVQFQPPTFDIDGNPDTNGEIPWLQKAEDDNWQVNYDWQVMYPELEGTMTFDIILLRNTIEQKIGDQDGIPTQIDFLLGDKLEVKNISASGGFDNTFEYEFFLTTDQNTGDRDGGVDVPLLIGPTDIPVGTDVVTVECRVGAKAGGANDNTGEFFPQTFVAFEDTDSLGFIKIDDVVDTTPTYEISFNPTSGSGDFANSSLNQTHTVTGTFTITNPRPGFDWDNPQFPMDSVGCTKTATVINTDFAFGSLTITEGQKTVTESSATNEFELTFSGQDILDSNVVFTDDMSFTVIIALVYDAEGIDPADGDAEDPDGSYDEGYSSQTEGTNASYSFNILQDDTTNDFDIKDPAKRRGVFDVVGIKTFSGSNSSIPNAPRPQDLDSAVKTPVRQIELAPCQLKCNSQESFTTVLMPTEEISRFHENNSVSTYGWPGTGEFEGIRGTKNKFAIISGGLLDNNGLPDTNDESGIRNDDPSGSPLTVPGNPQAKVNLITNGGIGERISRKRDDGTGTLSDILVPSDLAVYYYNKNKQTGQLCNATGVCEGVDNTGQDCVTTIETDFSGNESPCSIPTLQDLGWVYYRAHSKKARIGNNRFRQNGSDYSPNDFDVPNTDDGLKFVQWEKLAGDQGGFLDTAGAFNGNEPEIGAYVFLLDDRYDNVQTPTDEELLDKTKWPVPFSSVFSLSDRNPDASELASDIRNNPTMYELFAEEGAVNDIVDIIDYRLKSLDNGTDGNDPIVFDTTGVPAPVDSSDTDAQNWKLAPPEFPSPSTRNSDEDSPALDEIIPLSITESLYISGPNTNFNNDREEDVYEITAYGLPDGRLDSPCEGIGFDFTNGGDRQFCNFKSHFWNGKGVDLEAELGEVTSSMFDDSATLKGSIPLIWRRADTPYFVHYTAAGPNGSVFNNSSILPEPIGSQINPTSNLAYHGINIFHSDLHKRMEEQANDTGNNDVVPLLQYVVEVIRGGSVYHRDMYRLSGVQSNDPQVRTRADGNCPSCIEEIQENGEVCCQTTNTNCGSANAEDADMQDTLYQFGLDGEAWKDDTQAATSWYAPSDWRAGDTIRIYAIVAHIEGDTVVDGDGNVVEATPTPAISRIKKYCPVGVPVIPGIQDCCQNLEPLTTGCTDGTVCIVVCYLPDEEDQPPEPEN